MTRGDSAGRPSLMSAMSAKHRLQATHDVMQIPSSHVPADENSQEGCWRAACCCAGKGHRWLGLLCHLKVASAKECCSRHAAAQPAHSSGHTAFPDPLASMRECLLLNIQRQAECQPRTLPTASHQPSVLPCGIEPSLPTVCCKSCTKVPMHYNPSACTGPTFACHIEEAFTT